LLNWYEEGAWTPNQGSGLTIVGTFSSSGTYVRIGRQVTVQAHLAGSTSISWSAHPALISTNLPWASASGREFTGNGHNQSYLTSFAVFTGGSAYLYAIESQTAVASVDISITYFV
jgi:hypothetical protein